MQIAAYPPSERWLTIPEFPPPGWERERARRQSLRLGLHTPDRRAELERLLREVQRMDRPTALARMLYLGDDAQSLFAVDIGLVIAHDDGTKAARHWAQQQLLRRILGPVQPVRLRPSPDIAGFWGRADGEAVGTISHPGVVVVRDDQDDVDGEQALRVIAQVQQPGQRRWPVHPLHLPEQPLQLGPPVGGVQPQAEALTAGPLALPTGGRELGNREPLLRRRICSDLHP